MKKILFENEEFREGVNYTVRMGVYWAQALQIKDILKVNETFKSKDGHVIEVISVTICKLENMTEESLQKNHDLKCVTYEGLLQTLRECYKIPKEEMHNKTVTVIGFKAFKVKAV